MGPEPPAGMERVDVRHALHPLSALEADACQNAVQLSRHTRLKMLPNHHMNTEGELQGYVFTCSRDDTANVLPMSKKTCSMTCVYECLSDDTGPSPLNTHVMRIVEDMPKYRALLDGYVSAMRHKTSPFASFACIPEARSTHTRTAAGEIDFVLQDSVDQSAWEPNVPAKLGLYHSFTRTNTNDTREHKLYVVVSGCLTHAAEELHNLWLDAGEHISCGQLLECQELQWLRRATHRSHNRIAADVSVLFGLRLQRVLDRDSPVVPTYMALPTTVTYTNDIRPAALAHEMQMSESACFADASDNGVVMDMFSSEGFWLFQGPRDHSNYNMYGTIFGSTASSGCFPTRNIAYHDKYAGHALTTVSVQRDRTSHNTIYGTAAGSRCRQFLFPDENFLRTAEILGFNRNDGILSLMPLVCYVGDE
jgi:hypothetical protein